MERRRAFVWIEILLLFYALVLSFLLTDFLLIIPLILVIVLSLLYIKVFLQLLGRIKFWIIVISPIIISAFLAGERDLSFYFLNLSSSGAVIGVTMAVRAFCLMLTVALMFSRVSLSALIRFFEARGLKGFGLSIGVAYNMLFSFSRTGRVVFETLRLRGMIRRHPFKSIRLYIVSVISSTLQHGDDIVNAATVKAFDIKS
ncbi:MAG: hypothetical protein JSV25_02875 [Spirochaetota bacterium]|nr:MAG: hypothetical protein JSV25_02875 [Spirochaetota bacterium]